MKVEGKNSRVIEDGVQLAPSILDADFARLGDQVTQAEQAGASRIHLELELDGGINVETGRLGVAAGANVLVAGSAIFGAVDGVVAAMKRLRDATRLL